MYYEIKRYNKPLDFASHCKPFETQPCARCGKTPENPSWAVCNACLAVKDVTAMAKADKAKKNQTEKNRQKKVDKVCQVCKKIFTTRVFEVQHGRGRFCSKGCANKARSPDRTALGA